MPSLVETQSFLLTGIQLLQRTYVTGHSTSNHCNYARIHAINIITTMIDQLSVPDP